MRVDDYETQHSVLVQLRIVADDKCILPTDLL